MNSQSLDNNVHIVHRGVILQYNCKSYAEVHINGMLRGIHGLEGASLCNV